MGTYTNYAQIGARAWNAGRYRKAQVNRPAPVASPETVYVRCGACGQSFPDFGTCTICEVKLVDRPEAPTMPKHVDYSIKAPVDPPYGVVFATLALVVTSTVFMGGLTYLDSGLGRPLPFAAYETILASGASTVVVVAVLAASFHLVRNALRRRRIRTLR
jgi:hypothetical protein